MSKRSTEAIREDDKLDLCATCLKEQQENFRNLKKFKSPKHETPTFPSMEDEL